MDSANQSSSPRPEDCSFRVFFGRPAGDTDENHLSSFLGQKQETTHTAFCNNLVWEMEGLEEKEFQTFRNEAVKLLISIQSRAEELGRQPQQPQQQTLLNSSATSTFVPQTFQPPQQPAPATRGIHLNHPRDSDTCKPGHPT